MAIAWVQDKNFNESTASSSFTTAYNSNVTAANLLTVAIMPSGGGTVSSVTDNLNGSWTAAASESTAPTAFIYYLKNTLGGACTLTITLSAGVNCDVIQAEWSGCDTSSPLDQTNTAAATSSGGAVTSGSVTTTVANELLLAAVHVGSTATAGESGWSFLGNTTTFAATARSNLYEFKIVSATGTYSGTGTQSSATGTYGGAIATFKQASGSTVALPSTTMQAAFGITSSPALKSVLGGNTPVQIQGKFGIAGQIGKLAISLVNLQALLGISGAQSPGKATAGDPPYAMWGGGF